MRLGTLIALMVSEGEDWKQVEIPALEPVTPTAAPPTVAPPTAADPAPPPTTTPSALTQSVSANETVIRCCNYDLLKIKSIDMKSLKHIKMLV